MFGKSTRKPRADTQLSVAVGATPFMMTLKRESLNMVSPKKKVSPLVELDKSIMMETGDSFFPSGQKKEQLNRAAGIGDSFYFNQSMQKEEEEDRILI